MTLKRALHNIRYLHGKTVVNPLAYIFLYFSFVTGFGFIVLSALQSDHALTMYQIMVDSSGYGGTALWGVMAVGAALGALAALVWRKRWIAETSAFLGFGLWFYLGWVYGNYGYLDGIFIAIIPNLAFWVWYSFQIEWYRRIFCHHGD